MKNILHLSFPDKMKDKLLGQADVKFEFSEVKQIQILNFKFRIQNSNLGK